MATLTHFKDRRTGAVYVTKESTLPTEGRVPMKPAYKSDTVWLDRAYLDRVQDPHKWTPWQTIGFLFVFLVVAGAWLYASVQTHNQFNIDVTNSLILTAGWYVLILSWTAKLFGLAHV